MLLAFSEPCTTESLRRCLQQDNLIVPNSSDSQSALIRAIGAQAEDAVSTLEACPLCQRSRRQRVLVAALYKRANSRNSVKGQLCNIKRTFTVSSAVA